MDIQKTDLLRGLSCDYIIDIFGHRCSGPENEILDAIILNYSAAFKSQSFFHSFPMS